MKRTLEWEVLDIIEDDENMSQHARRVYWANEIIRLVRADEQQRIVEIVEAIEHWTAYDQHGDMHACYASDPIAAIKGGSDA